MPVKLIGTIILLILVTIFAGVNLDNKCDITFIFYTFKDVPVFMTVIISFVIGVILMIPFTFGRTKKKAQQPQQTQPVQNQQPKEESKTLFDFKIKRDATAAENKEKTKKENKNLFGFKKNNEKSVEKSSDGTSNSDDSSTGAPV
ncbi:hypothetical protein [Treponema sp.]|uniref:hypothetical protein n=1 Tax=Treponema sp. TaxID=166 RepID=UPI00388E8F2A